MGGHQLDETCRHLHTVVDVTPVSTGCDACVRVSDQWVHLRLCMVCGYVGCCDDSPMRHTRAHWQAFPGHPVIRSFEPGEDWWWCYADQLLFDVKGAPHAP
jgi:hypothetical protein